MSARVLPFDAATHKIADVLLPWFVNGTLEDEERALVEQHLGQCERCRREVEWLRELHAACAGASSAVPRLRERLMARQARWQRAHPWSHAVMAAQLAAIVVLGAVVVGDETRAPYRTLGAGESTARTSASLVIVFDPAVTELDLRRMLHAVGARIVDGPTQANAYLLAVTPGAREQALRALKGDRRVVLVEPLGEGSGR